MIPNVRSPDRRGKRDNPDPIWPGKGGAVPPADGRLKSLVVYLTTAHLKEFKENQRTKLPKEKEPCGAL